MDTAKVMEFLILLGADDATIMEDQMGVQASCPLARWLHRSTASETPSLVVRIHEAGREPRFRCTVCGARGSLPELLHELQTLSTELYPEATSLLAQWEESGLVKFGSIPRRVRVDLPPPEVLCPSLRSHDPIEQAALDLFPLLIRMDQHDSEFVIRWLRSHWRISSTVIQRAQLRLYYDAITKEPGVAVPVFAPGGKLPTELWGWPLDSEQGRQIYPAQPGTPTANLPHPLFGLERLEPGSPVILVQHPLAALKLETIGLKYVVATTGSGNMDLSDLEGFPGVYLAFNNSDAGHALIRRAFRLLKRPQIVLLLWSHANSSEGQPLHSPLELESLDQFRSIFDKRMALTK